MGPFSFGLGSAPSTPFFRLNNFHRRFRPSITTRMRRIRRDRPRDKCPFNIFIIIYSSFLSLSFGGWLFFWRGKGGGRISTIIEWSADPSLLCLAGPHPGQPLPPLFVQPTNTSPVDRRCRGFRPYWVNQHQHMYRESLRRQPFLVVILAS